MSRGRLVAALVLATTAGAGPACHNCQREPSIVGMMEGAKLNYDNKNFELAGQIYINVLDDCPDYYDAIVGLANAFREYGNVQYKAANEASRQGQTDLAEQKYIKGEGLHSDSDRYLRTALESRPNDLMPHYYLGMLWYQRATSPLNFPYPQNDTSRRQRDRDNAIAEFQTVVGKVPQVHQVHRYLFILLFAADRRDEARHHLERFHDALQTLYNGVLNAAARTPIQKEEKDKELARLEREIDEVRDVIIEYRADLQKEIDRLKSKDQDSLKEEERKEMRRLGSEKLVLEAMVGGFELIDLAPHEEALRQRCQDYLDAYRRGEEADVRTYLRPKPGKYVELERSIRQILAEGTKYEQIVWKTITAPGETAITVFDCDRVTKSGKKSGVRISIRWRLHNGLWMVEEHQ